MPALRQNGGNHKEHEGLLCRGYQRRAWNNEGEEVQAGLPWRQLKLKGMVRRGTSFHEGTSQSACFTQYRQDILGLYHEVQVSVPALRLGQTRLQNVHPGLTNWRLHLIQDRNLSHPIRCQKKMPSAGHLKHETRLGPIQPSLTFSSMALVEPSTTLGCFSRHSQLYRALQFLGRWAL